AGSVERRVATRAATREMAREEDVAAEGEERTDPDTAGELEIDARLRHEDLHSVGPAVDRGGRRPRGLLGLEAQNFRTHAATEPGLHMRAEAREVQELEAHPHVGAVTTGGASGVARRADVAGEHAEAVRDVDPEEKLLGKSRADVEPNRDL